MLRACSPRNLVLLLVCAVCMVTVSAHSGDSGHVTAAQATWPSYGADLGNSKSVPLDQITPDNVKHLRIAWRWSSMENTVLEHYLDLWTMVNEATPLMIDGRLYTGTSLYQVAAIDARTGQTLWVYHPETYWLGSPPNLGFLHRGVAYWADGEDKRIFIGTGGAYLIALDANTGKPIPAFGDHGRIDLTRGLCRSVDRTLYGVSSPPIICRNIVIVGATISDSPNTTEMPPASSRRRLAARGAGGLQFAMRAMAVTSQARPLPVGRRSGGC